MKVVVDLPVGDEGFLVSAVVERMKADGLVVVAPKRSEPYDVAELRERCKISKSSIQRMVEAGVFVRLRHTARILVTAASVEAWMEGRDLK